MTDPTALQLVLQFVVAPLGAAALAVTGTLLGVHMTRTTVEGQTSAVHREAYLREQRQLAARVLSSYHQLLQALTREWNYLERFAQRTPTESTMQEAKSLSKAAVDARAEFIRLGDELILITDEVEIERSLVRQSIFLFEVGDADDRVYEAWLSGDVEAFVDARDSANPLLRNDANLHQEVQHFFDISCASLRSTASRQLVRPAPTEQNHK